MLSNLSYIGLGFMRHDPSNFNNTQQIVDFAMKCGVNYYESCQFYLGGQCENIVAKALSKYQRDSYYLCAKLDRGYLLNQTIEEVFQAQLNNLNTDYVDNYLIQAVDKASLPILKKYNVIPFLLNKKKEGKIKNLGFSFHDTPDVLEGVLKLGCWDYVQLQLNYYDYFLSTGKDNYELTVKYNVPVIVMGANKGGTLVNNMPQEAKELLGENFKEYPYMFLKSLDNVKCILSGAENVFQLGQNLKIGLSNKKCTEEDIDKIRQAIMMYKDKNYIQCTGCRYCQPCPAGIDIPNLFAEYNNVLKYGKQYSGFKKYMGYIHDEQPVHNCRRCGRCENRCPQHLKIQDIFYKNIFQMRL